MPLPQSPNRKGPLFEKPPYTYDLPTKSRDLTLIEYKIWIDASQAEHEVPSMYEEMYRQNRVA